jgi:hypothetical protein
MMQLMIEAIIVGFITTIASYGFDTTKKLNLFLMGVVIHLVFEIVGANKMYCKSGYACQ